MDNNFGNFYETWLTKQQGFLDQLLQILKLNDFNDQEKHLGLISQVLEHYQCHRDEISKAAGENVLRALSAPWLSSFEKTLLWISGFRPSIMFRLVEGAVKDLTAAQATKLEELKEKVKQREKELTEAMAGLQEKMATSPTVRLTEWEGRLVNGEVCEMENKIDEMKTGMLGVFDGADLLRGLTMKSVMEILRNDQKVRVLAAVMEFQLRIRRWGVKRDLQRTRVHNPQPHE